MKETIFILLSMRLNIVCKTSQTLKTQERPFIILTKIMANKIYICSIQTMAVNSNCDKDTISEAMQIV